MVIERCLWPRIITPSKFLFEHLLLIICHISWFLDLFARTVYKEALLADNVGSMEVCEI